MCGTGITSENSGRAWSLSAVLILFAVVFVIGCQNDPTITEPTETDLEGDRINSFYTNEEIRYLLDIALHNDSVFQHPIITRWIVPAVITTKGEPTEEDVQTLNEVVSELDALTREIGITIDTLRPNVEIYFIPRAAFSSIVPEYPFPQFSYTSHTLTLGQLAKILIATDSTTQSDRSAYIRRELARSLGFRNTSREYPNSVFYAGWKPEPANRYAQIDRTIIQMLYSSGIRSHMTRQDVIRTMTDR